MVKASQSFEQSSVVGKVSSHQQPLCPQSGWPGKYVPLITLKSLLLPHALEQLDVTSCYAFCSDSSCPVVYFSQEGKAFDITDLKVTVFQKAIGQVADVDLPVCYCFGWSRQRIQKEIQQFKTGEQILGEITAHIQAKRCGCEVNNPQGSCCLSNVRRILAEIASRGGEPKA